MTIEVLPTENERLFAMNAELKRWLTDLKATQRAGNPVLEGNTQGTWAEERMKIGFPN